MDTGRRIYLCLFDSVHGARGHLIARWLFLRALGIVYFSAFFALLFQVKGLIGTDGILPAGDLLDQAQRAGVLRFWYVPSLLWISSSDHMLMALMWIGLIASVLLIANVWPRAMLLICFVCFLSFVSAAQEFSGYQSDGMLLEAGFLSLFLAPPGILPGWGATHPPARAAILLLLYEWFRIYFESGVVKLASGDPTWRNLTAMYEYYQNGPLPTWIGWYAEQLPHWFQRGTAGATLFMELVLVWMAFLPRRWRIACFFIVTVWQVGVILTANYAFLNYLVLFLAILLLDDEFLRRVVPQRWRSGLKERISPPLELGPKPEFVSMNLGAAQQERGERPRDEQPEDRVEPDGEVRAFRWPGMFHSAGIAVTAVAMIWIFYATTVEMLGIVVHEVPLPASPVAALEPFRIANQYGLFAVMTPHRYEIEFQGSNDGATWTAYPFRYKPQDPHERPRIYAPYQPRFDWNLWFASLGSWMENPLVPRTQVLLLKNDQDVLGLFDGNPFGDAPPKYVRTVLWQYWFSNREEKRMEGVWWTRKELGTYSPTIARLDDGRLGIVASASLHGPPDSQ
ncbi:MAG TPA: lipase maturation factor family protein [Acidobacteriaceae bacterium]|nr:lipase maturation factor family protein [Acidobacteriaceae bacterium]